MLICAINEDNSFRTLDEINQEYIQRVLWSNEGDVLKTAKQIGIGKSTIYRLIKENKIKNNG